MPPSVAPADLRAGEVERLAEWLAGACMAARAAADVTGDKAGIVAVTQAIARLKAATVSQAREGIDQELLADEMLSLCLAYPADVALRALNEAKHASKFFPLPADLGPRLEALMEVRRAWLQTVESWPAQIADGRQSEDLQARHARARRIVRRLEAVRDRGPWFPADQVQLDAQQWALARLSERLSAAGIEALPDSAEADEEAARKRIASALGETARGIRERDSAGREEAKAALGGGGAFLCVCHGVRYRRVEEKPGQCSFPCCKASPLHTGNQEAPADEA